MGTGPATDELVLCCRQHVGVQATDVDEGGLVLVMMVVVVVVPVLRLGAVRMRGGSNQFNERTNEVCWLLHRLATHSSNCRRLPLSS